MKYLYINNHKLFSFILATFFLVGSFFYQAKAQITSFSYETQSTANCIDCVDSVGASTWSTYISAYSTTSYDGLRVKFEGGAGILLSLEQVSGSQPPTSNCQELIEGDLGWSGWMDPNACGDHGPDIGVRFKLKNTSAILEARICGDAGYPWTCTTSSPSYGSETITPGSGWGNLLLWDGHHNAAIQFRIVDAGQPPVPQNAGILSIDEPVNACSHSDSEQVTISVTNYGTDTIDSLDVSYRMNNGPIVTERIYQTILPYDTINGKPTDTATHTFSTTEDLSGSGPYAFDAWTSLNNDTVNSNDTIKGKYVQPLSGTLTVGGNNPDFNNVTDAVNALESIGICDSVFINIVDTTINEQLDIGSIPGASDSSLVTFQSASGDSTAVVLFYNGTSSADNYVVNFNNTSYVRFKDLTLANSGATYSTVVRYVGDATDNFVTNSELQGDLATATTSTNKAVIYANGNNISNNTIRNSVIKGGSYGIYSYDLKYTTLDGNQFIDQYYQGGYFYDNENLKVLNNSFETNSTYTGTMYRFYFYYCYPGLAIRGNTIKGMQTGYGFYIRYSYLNNKGYVANNFIHMGDTGSTTSSYGIYTYYSDNLMIAHNSISIESAGTNSMGVYTYYGSDNSLLNNNVYNSGPGYAFYLFGSGVIESDHNNIYAPNGTMAYSSTYGTHNSLSSWQGASGYDSNSVSVDPMYVGGDDLHTCQYALDGAGTYLNQVKKDIDGEKRDNPNPDIGADEFLAPASFSLGPDVDKCPSETATLGFPNSNADFMWSNGDTTSTTNVASPGTYSVMAITTCDTLLDTVQVNDMEEPTANFKTDKTNNTVYLENRSTYADSFFWYMGDGYTSDLEDPFLHIYDSAGTYTVMLIASGECGTDTTTRTVTIEPPDTGTGISEVRSMQMQLYPNPTHDGQFTLVVPNTDKLGHQATLSIMDVTGKAIYTEAIELNNHNHYRINNATLESGVYYVRLTGQKASVVRKLVVN